VRGIWGRRGSIIYKMIVNNIDVVCVGKGKVCVVAADVCCNNKK
jgi:hypothetical protein